jgi:hypothetical protein
MKDGMRKTGTGGKCQTEARESTSESIRHTPPASNCNNISVQTKMNRSILFSIAACACPECMQNLVDSLYHSTKNKAIAVHVCASSNLEAFRNPRMLLNNVQLPMKRVGSYIINAHMLNVLRFGSKSNTSHVYFVSQNMLFVKPGVDEYIRQHHRSCASHLHADWYWYTNIKNDVNFRNASHHAILEGSFYKYDDIVDTLTQFPTINEFPVEEVWFPSRVFSATKSHCVQPTLLIRWENNLFIEPSDIDNCRRTDWCFSVKRVPMHMDASIRRYGSFKAKQYQRSQ